MTAHLNLCGLFLVVLGHTGYGARIGRDDASPMSVITIEEHPYVIIKDSGEAGNDKFTGFIPELLLQIGDKIQMGYNLRLVHDEKYGEKDNNNNWNGMVGQLQQKKADLAAAPITISEDRKSVIDFTEPFMDVGLSVLYKKPGDGQERAFDTLEELVEIPDMKYGLVKGGMTENTFKESTNVTIQNLWQKIQNPNQGEGRLPNNGEGATKVRESDGKYVFIMESTTADFYKNQKPCELDTLPIFKKNQYAFGLQKGSQYKTGINKAIKELKESGKIQELRDRFWTGECVPRDKGNSVHTSMTSASLVFLGFLLYMMS